jgi:hypothetical protein
VRTRVSTEVRPLHVPHQAGLGRERPGAPRARVHQVRRGHVLRTLSHDLHPVRLGAVARALVQLAKQPVADRALKGFVFLLQAVVA